jgi:hypothetical protein
LLVVGLLARWTDLIRLNPPYDALTDPVVLIVLGVVALIEFVGDKIPVVDHVLHAVGVVVHPAAGMVVFLAANNAADGIDPRLAAACGLALALGAHGARMAYRPLVTATTGGLGNWAVSLIEDVVAVVLAILAIVVPALAAALVVLAVLLVGRRVGRMWRRWRDRKRLRPPPLPTRRR